MIIATFEKAEVGCFIRSSTHLKKTLFAHQPDGYGPGLQTNIPHRQNIW